LYIFWQTVTVGKKETKTAASYRGQPPYGLSQYYKCGNAMVLLLPQAKVYHIPVETKYFGVDVYWTI